jgi:hypothetical protein
MKAAKNRKTASALAGSSKPRVVGSNPAGRARIGLFGPVKHQTVKQFASLSGLTPRQVRDFIHRGPLRAFRCGRELLIEVPW